MNVSPNTLERGVGHVTVVLTQNEGIPPIPYELQNLYSTDTWTTRIEAANQLCRDWTRPVIERVYFFVAICVQFIIPSLISGTVLSKLYSSGPNDEIPPEKFFEFRAVGMAVFIGTLILVWTPLIVWKTLGRRKVRALQTEWLTVDRATARGGFVPRWIITKPGIFSSTQSVRVTVPQVPVIVTSFHPQAPLPPYINPPGYEGYGYAQDEKVAFGAERV